MKVENGIFTLLVFNSAGGMVLEFKIFIKQLSSLVTDTLSSSILDQNQQFIASGEHVISITRM